MKRTLLLLLTLAATTSMAIMSWHYLLPGTSGILVGKPVAEHAWYRLAFRTHVGVGGLAMLLGVGLLITANRTDRRGAHRKLGYAYLLAILLSGTAGLLLTPYTIGGWWSGSGLLLLDVLWITLTIRSVRAARTGNLTLHRQLATYSLALTYSAITLRVLLLLALTDWVPFVSVYRFATWACWPINLALAWGLGRRGGKKSRKEGEWGRGNNEGEREWRRKGRAEGWGSGGAVLCLLLTLCLGVPRMGRGQTVVKGTYELTVRVTGLRSGTGMVRICLIDAPERFLGDCRISREAAARVPTLAVTFPDLPAGTYAITLYHDVNNDGRLNGDGPFGLPSEPYGFSNNPRSWFGPPRYERCTFDLRSDRTITVAL